MSVLFVFQHLENLIAKANEEKTDIGNYAGVCMVMNSDDTGSDDDAD